MSARETLSRLTAAGFTLQVNEAGDKVKISPIPVPEELVDLVRADKLELLRLLAALEPTDSYPLHAGSGAPFMPWCAPISARDFARWRQDLIRMIEDLAAIEGWPREHLDDVLTRALNGPVSDLRPNWHHFRERLAAAQKTPTSKR